MIDKIISGGQTGADQAALDVAVKFNIPHGGWVPKGRKTEAGPLPLRYRLTQMPTTDYRDRTRKNVMASQGTVIFYRSRITGGSRLTMELAETCGKPFCALDLMVFDPFEAAVMLQSFLGEHSIGILNVAGPRASHDPGMYADVKLILETLLYLVFLEQENDFSIPFASGEEPVFPDSLDAAVQVLVKDLSLKEKTDISRLEDTQIMDIYFSWLDFLRRFLGLEAGNKPLAAACQKRADTANFTIEDAVMEIIKALKFHCDQTYQLRVVR